MSEIHTSLDDLVEQAQPVVVRVLRRRFRGASLSPSDDRRENDRALDCFQQAMLDLCAKFCRVLDGSDPPILDVGHYAARVAHNVANDEIRYSGWSRLSNRVRRVLSKDIRFDVWEHPELGRVAGYTGWRVQRQASGSVSALREAIVDFRTHAALGTHWERLGSGDWGDILEQTFNAAGGPLPIGRLVHFLAEILNVSDELPLDDSDDEDSVEPEPVGPGPRPDDAAIVREQLVLLWACVRQLRREWRLAFLMNLPSIGEPRPADDRGKANAGSAGARPRTSGRGTARGEIDVLPANRVASITEIGESLELTHDDYRRIFAALSPDPQGDGASEVAPIYGLWSHLPLPDRVIGLVLGKTAMQVLALRKLAIRQLAGCMRESGRGAGPTKQSRSEAEPR